MNILYGTDHTWKFILSNLSRTWHAVAYFPWCYGGFSNLQLLWLFILSSIHVLPECFFREFFEDRVWIPESCRTAFVLVEALNLCHLGQHLFSSSSFYQNFIKINPLLLRQYCFLKRAQIVAKVHTCTSGKYTCCCHMLVQDYRSNKSDLCCSSASPGYAVLHCCWSISQTELHWTLSCKIRRCSFYLSHIHLVICWICYFH